MAKPNCYGDSDYFSEVSRICNNCGYRLECKSTVNKDINRNWSTPGTSTTAKTKQTNGSIGPIMLNGPSPLSIGNSVYNHKTALAPQFIRYLGYSVAESTIEEAKILVQSMRSNYVAEQVKATTPLTVTNVEKKDT